MPAQLVEPFGEHVLAGAPEHSRVGSVVRSPYVQVIAIAPDIEAIVVRHRLGEAFNIAIDRQATSLSLDHERILRTEGRQLRPPIRNGAN